MSKKEPIQCFEYSTLRVGDFGFNTSHLEQLVAYNEEHNNELFIVGRNKITFNSYVGVIQVSDLTIEILPKGDLVHESGSQKDKWRKALLSMLSECKRIPLKGLQSAHLNQHTSSLFEFYIGLFLNEVEEIVRQGLIKKYSHVADQQTSLKGSIDFPRHIVKNLVHKERFYVNHQVYDLNHYLNKVLKTALNIVRYLNISESLRGRANNLYLSFGEIGEIKFNSEIIRNFVFSRHSAKYEHGIQLALLILEQYNPRLESGNNSLIAFLFNMNELFEEFIYRRLKRAEFQYSHLNLKISAQISKLFWENRSIRPDIVLEYTLRGEKKTVVVDTKWKLLDSIAPGMQDLRQMYAYNLYFNCDRSILLYPDTGIEGKYGVYQKSYPVLHETHGCEVMFVNPINDDGILDSNFAHQLIETILKSHTVEVRS